MTLYVGSKKIAQKIGVASTGVKLPDQTDNAGKFLSTDGTVLAWTNPTEQVEQDIASINEKLIKKTHVTNCITEIPQDIKMVIESEIGDMWYAWVSYVYGYVLYSKTETVAEGDSLYKRDNYGNYNAVRTIGTDVTIDSETRLIDDTNMSIPLIRDSEYDRGELYYDLILKAGSKLYFPAGLEEESGIFNISTTEEDIKIRNNSKNDGRYLIIHNGSELFLENLHDILTVRELPTENISESIKYYDLATNKIHHYNGTDWEELYQSLPLGIIIIKNYKIYDFDEVFNGFGFMGNLAFALPGIKSLLPFGKNDDGSYNSEEYTQENIKLALRTWKPEVKEYLVYGNDYFGFEEQYFEQTVQPENRLYSFWYNPESNYMMYYHTLLLDWYRYSEMCVASNLSDDSEIITDWNIKKVFKIADQNDVNDRIEEVSNELETVLDTKLDNKIDEVNTEINEVRDYAENVQENVEAVDSKLEEFKQTIKIVNSLPENPEIGVLYFVRA